MRFQRLQKDQEIFDNTSAGPVHPYFLFHYLATAIFHSWRRRARLENAAAFFQKYEMHIFQCIHRRAGVFTRSENRDKMGENSVASDSRGEPVRIY